MSTQKILALQFKYFGDAVLMTPAVRALRTHFPQAELHVLVPEPMAPLFQHLSWITRVWAMPRQRGSAKLSQTWPLLRELRRQHFDRSVDFASNDRGAIISRLIGARERLGWDERGGFWGRKFCYTTRVVSPKPTPHESVRLAHLLTGWKVPPPASFAAEIGPDPQLAEAAQKLLPHADAILCHIASSREKKEWALTHWVNLYRLAKASGHRLIFTTAQGQREQALTESLKKLSPDLEVLPLISDLPLLLAVLGRAKMFVSGDTGPLHFAAGLGVPTVSLYGPTSALRWAPQGARHLALTGGECVCSRTQSACTAPQPCLSAISPVQVLAAIQSLLPP